MSSNFNFQDNDLPNAEFPMLLRFERTVKNNPFHVHCFLSAIKNKNEVLYYENYKGYTRRYNKALESGVYCAPHGHTTLKGVESYGSFYVDFDKGTDLQSMEDHLWRIKRFCDKINYYPKVILHTGGKGFHTTWQNELVGAQDEQKLKIYKTIRLTTAIILGCDVVPANNIVQLQRLPGPRPDGKDATAVVMKRDIQDVVDVYDKLKEHFPAALELAEGYVDRIMHFETFDAQAKKLVISLDGSNDNTEVTKNVFELLKDCRAKKEETVKKHERVYIAPEITPENIDFVSVAPHNVEIAAVQLMKKSIPNSQTYKATVMAIQGVSHVFGIDYTKSLIRRHMKGKRANDVIRSLHHESRNSYRLGTFIYVSKIINPHITFRTKRITLTEDQKQDRNQRLADVAWAYAYQLSMKNFNTTRIFAFDPKKVIEKLIDDCPKLIVEFQQTSSSKNPDPSGMLKQYLGRIFKRFNFTLFHSGSTGNRIRMKRNLGIEEALRSKLDACGFAPTVYTNNKKHPTPREGYMQRSVRTFRDGFLDSLAEPIIGEHIVINQCWTDLWPSPQHQRDHYGRFELPITDKIKRNGLEMSIESMKMMARVGSRVS